MLNENIFLELQDYDKLKMIERLRTGKMVGNIMLNREDQLGFLSWMV
jgi:hypothetical protein